MTRTGWGLGACVLAAVVCAACATEDPFVASGQGAVISDGAHNGNPHFYFLAPMVPNPRPDGTFDGSLAAEVRICFFDAQSQRCMGEVALFTLDSGPGAETIRVSEDDEHYIVNWSLDDLLDTGSTFRIRVLADGQLLGFADVVVAGSNRELKNVNTDEYVPLLEGGALPIKFRIEEGALSYAPASVAAGALHTCRVDDEGHAYCSGDNKFGQLGNGGFGWRELSPTAVEGGHTFASIYAGNFNTCALTPEGQAYCWGYNFSGSVGNGSTNRSSPYSEATPQLVAGGHTFVELAMMDMGTCGLTPLGEVYCWGHGSDGRLGNGTAIAASTPTLVAGGYQFRALSSASEARHMCGVTATGEALCWGYNNKGQLGNGTTRNAWVPSSVSTSSKFSSLSRSQSNTCGVTLDDVAYCWGDNLHGAIGDGTELAARTPRAVDSQERFQLTSSSSEGGCGLTLDGAAYCWGSNEHGALGIGSIDGWSLSPVAVETNERFVSLTSGLYYHCGEATTGAVLCWGDNSYGQLGIGSYDQGGEPLPLEAMILE